MTEYDVGVTSRVVIKADSKQEAENIAIKNIQNCLEPYYIEADIDAQPVKWLMELKDLKAEQNDQYVFIHELMSKLKEAKRLLKAAVEDLSNTAAEAYNGHVICKCCKWLAETVYCKCPNDGGCDITYQWRYADEALKLIGDSENDEP